jgi:hypothetical protein
VIGVIQKVPIVEIIGFKGSKSAISARVVDTNNLLNGLYPSDLKEKVLFNKESFEKLLEEKERKFNEELNSIKAKIQFLEETGNEEYSETEFKVYQTLKTLKNENLSETQRAKIIAQLINK